MHQRLPPSRTTQTWRSQAVSASLTPINSPTRPSGPNTNTNTYGSDAAKLAGDTDATCIYAKSNVSIPRHAPSSQ
jgi:hypothetical protein